MKLSSETMITNQIKCHGSIQTTLEDDVNVPDVDREYMHWVHLLSGRPLVRLQFGVPKWQNFVIFSRFCHFLCQFSVGR